MTKVILDACFEIPKLEDSILNFQILFNIRNMELKITTYKKNMFMICDTKGGRYCTDLDAYTSKQQKFPVHAKCYYKEIMSPGCLLFINLGLYTDYISAFTC